MSARPKANLRRGALRFAALGDPTRLRLVTRMCDLGPSSIARLTAGAEVTRQALSKHLQVLEQAGLARSQRQGREVHWRLVPSALDETRLHLERLAEGWESALGRLKDFVEDQGLE